MEFVLLLSYDMLLPDMFYRLFKYHVIGRNNIVVLKSYENV